MYKKFKNGALWGSIIGTSIGLAFGSQMSPMQRRRFMRSARRATSTLRDGINSFWG